MKWKKLHFFLSVPALVLSGCKSVDSRPVPPLHGSQQFIAVIDLSASRSRAMESDAQSYLGREAALLNFGDRLVLAQMQQAGLTDHPRIWVVQIPSASDAAAPTTREKNRLLGSQHSMTEAISEAFASPDGATAQHTDILATLKLVGEQLQDGGGRRTTVFLLSDMLQSAQGIEMEHLRRMPTEGWLKEQLRLGLVPNLQGACVVVIGADVTDRSGIIVREFWKRYFSASGAILSSANYRMMPPATDPTVCESDSAELNERMANPRKQ